MKRSDYKCTDKSTPRKATSTDERVVLIDSHNRPIGVADKLDAHRRGLRHRAISVFLFNQRGETLLQQRAFGKYHSGGRWANTCCSHPRVDEEPMAAAERRLEEELGVRNPLQPMLTTTYRAPVGSGLIENELSYVFVGYYSGEVWPNPTEVADTRWVDLERLCQEVASTPDQYAVWLRIYLRRFKRKLRLAAASRSEGR